MFLGERSVRLVVVILMALLVGWKVRQHRLGAVDAPRPAAASSATPAADLRPAFPEE